MVVIVSKQFVLCSPAGGAEASAHDITRFIWNQRNIAVMIAGQKHDGARIEPAEVHQSSL